MNATEEEKAKELFFNGDCVVYLNGCSLVDRAIREGNKVYIVQCDFDYQERYCKIKEEHELKPANIEGLNFPICKTSYKRVIADLEKRGFILIGDKFLSLNYTLDFVRPTTDYVYEYPITKKGSINLS